MSGYSGDRKPVLYCLNALVTHGGLLYKSRYLDVQYRINSCIRWTGSRNLFTTVDDPIYIISSPVPKMVLNAQTGATEASFPLPRMTHLAPEVLCSSSLGPHRLGRPSRKLSSPSKVRAIGRL